MFNNIYLPNIKVIMRITTLALFRCLVCCTMMVNLLNVADEFQCDFLFPVAVCVENNSILDKTQCGFPFPVQVCAENDFLLDSAQCDFEFPEETCTAKPELFQRSVEGGTGTFCLTSRLAVSSNCLLVKL